MTPVTESIGTALARWVAFVLRFRIAVAVVSLVAVALAVYYAVPRLGINTDTADMISPELPWRRDFIEFRESFPARDRNLVVVITAPEPSLSDAFASALVERLEAEPRFFSSVFAAGVGEFFERNALLYFSLEQLEDLADRLAEAQPLIGLLKPEADGAAIVEAAARALDAGGEADALYRELAGAIRAASVGERDPVEWRRLMLGSAADELSRLAGAAGRRIVVLRPELDYDRVQPAAPAIEALRAIIDELKADEGFASVSARLTGTVAMEHEEMLSVKSGAGLAALASLAMVLAVLYAALRSLRLVLIALVTLVAGLAATAAFAAAAVGHLNLLSVAFAVLYVGLGVDFIFHFCLRLKELLAAGRSLDDAIVETARGVGASLVVCTLTTAVAFYAFIPTDFDGVSELGLISGTGMLVSFAVSFTLLPALLGSPSIARGRHRVPPWVPTRALVPVAAHPRIVVALAAAIAAGCAWLAPSAEFNSNPIHLRDPSTESVRALLELAEDGQAPVYDLVAVAPDRATAARWAEALRALPEVRAVTTVDALVPKDQEQKLYLLEDLALVMGPGFADVERGELEPERLERALASLRADLAATGASAELADAIDAFLARLERLDAHDRRTVLAALDADLSAALPDELARLERALTAEPVTLESLPMPLAERWIAPDGRTLVEISPSENVNDNDAAARFVAAVRSVVPDVTGLPVVYQEASNTVVGAFRIAFALALVLITAMLFVFMKGVRDVLLVVVPLGFACVVTVGVTVLLDLPFNFANLITLPLIFGIGVDNGIHVVHRMRSDPPADGNPFGTSTSVAVLACALTTIASFGNLGFAAHRGIASMGQLLTLGMTLVLVSTLVFLPALLKLGGKR